MGGFHRGRSAIHAAMLAVLASAASGDAGAVALQRTFAGNASAWCQGALPSYEGAIRKRPLSVQNEGTASAFVTCSFISQTPQDDLPPRTVARVRIWASSNDGTAHTLNCTGVAGYQGGSGGTAPQYVAKSVALPANGNTTSIIWNAADFIGAPAVFPSGLFSASCALPPGSGLNDMYLVFSEEVGS